MARRLQPIPLPAHPSPALFLLVTWVVAATAVVLSLCATCNRKSSSKPSSSPRSPSSDESVSKLAAAKPEAPSAAEPAPAAQHSKEEQKEASPPLETAAVEEENTAVTVIDDVATHGPIPPAVLPMSASKRKMSLSFSKGLPDKLRMSRRDRKDESGEDSLWKKTIILGEKCKVGSDEEEEEVVVIDDNGIKQRYYHPRTPKSRQASRNNSFACHDEASTTKGAEDRGTGDRRPVEN